ncbi:ATP-binding cassette domain-containing protein [Iocasia frigidifontis]|uniref:ATP-binding cassette domain-containing protein n=1 Tax=Iocasia fonsfrigidae TaxID=2682810 RepID=A0A8A7KAX5_9FIRM|nr:ABC transporter ATP-binding protein [Iocasia fonsfrigidae]QTL98936.1 ATP-binding cassette domain-containing protein [Iocasia fonsfrigidae]
MVDEEKQEILIDVKNLKLAYGTGDDSILALEDINLKIRRGEFLCVLGPSGCGKSTLLKTMAGYIKPTEGNCLMQGEAIEGPDWHRGVVFQSSTLYPWMSVKDNVEFGPKMRGLPAEEIEEIRAYFLEQVKLAGFGDKFIFELSGGMKQRVALARVLANYPQVILMDEPFGALDALTRNNMQNLIRNIWKDNNTTIFFITHDVDEALCLGTRIVVMSKRPGTILKEFNVGFTHQIFEHNSKDVVYKEDYFDIKNEILDLINSQIEE